MCILAAIYCYRYKKLRTVIVIAFLFFMVFNICVSLDPDMSISFLCAPLFPQVILHPKPFVPVLGYDADFPGTKDGDNDGWKCPSSLGIPCHGRCWACTRNLWIGGHCTVCSTSGFDVSDDSTPLINFFLLSWGCLWLNCPQTIRSSASGLMAASRGLGVTISTAISKIATSILPVEEDSVC